MAAITIIITEQEIKEALTRESSLVASNMRDGRGVSLVDSLVIDNEEMLEGAVHEAANTVYSGFRDFLTSFVEDTAGYQYHFTKDPAGLHDDILGYIADYAMSVWLARNGIAGEDYGARAKAALTNISRKLYYKAAPVY